jgi:hypothetical protein
MRFAAHRVFVNNNNAGAPAVLIVSRRAELRGLFAAVSCVVAGGVLVASAAGVVSASMLFGNVLVLLGLLAVHRLFARRALWI